MIIVNYLKLLRVKHYIKNVLVFIPLFFSQNFTDIALFKNVLWGGDIVLPDFFGSLYYQ